MDDLANIILILLMMFCAMGYFVAGLMMIVMRPARIDEQTGEPSRLWKAVTYMLFVLSAVNIRAVYSVQEYNIASWWSVLTRSLLVSALILILIALHKRHVENEHKKR